NVEPYVIVITFVRSAPGELAYFEDQRGRTPLTAKLLTRDETRRIAANIARLPDKRSKKYEAIGARDVAALGPSQVYPQGRPPAWPSEGPSGLGRQRAARRFAVGW